MNKIFKVFSILGLSLTLGILAIIPASALENEDFFFVENHENTTSLNSNGINSRVASTEFKETSRTVYVNQLTNDPQSLYPMTKNEVSKIVGISKNEMSQKEDLVVERLEKHINSNNLSRSTGSVGSKGKLTLTVISSSYVSGNKRYMSARVHSVWNVNGFWMAGSNGPTVNYDYISLALPGDYTLTSSSIAFNNKTNNYKTDEGLNSVVWAYRPKLSNNAGVTAQYSTLYTTGVKNGTTKNNEKVIAKYVHTWSSVRPSISVNSSWSAGVSFSSVQSSWQLAVSDFA